MALPPSFFFLCRNRLLSKSPHPCESNKPKAEKQHGGRFGGVNGVTSIKESDIIRVIGISAAIY